MSAALVLPFVWAYSCPPIQFTDAAAETPDLEPYFAYRTYTEALLRRYVTMSMEAGRAPSQLGKELFRGKVTSCRVEGFDDVVIFVHDVGRCIEKLDDEQQRLIRHIAVHEYTVQETAADLHLNPRTVVRRYRIALDRLTALLLDAGLLEQFKTLSREYFC